MATMHKRMIKQILMILVLSMGCSLLFGTESFIPRALLIGGLWLLGEFGLGGDNALIHARKTGQAH
jgi:hypothetical protein